jgi:hypothetical protein
MPRISKEKLEKIQEHVLYHLYEIFPRQIFTSDIAKEIARDEEFIKIIMQELEKKKLVVKIDKNPVGITYLKRARWRISNPVYEIYKKKSELGKNFTNNNQSSTNSSQNSSSNAQEKTIYLNSEPKIEKIEEKKPEDKTEEYGKKSAIPNYIA